MKTLKIATTRNPDIFSPFTIFPLVCSLRDSETRPTVFAQSGKTPDTSSRSDTFYSQASAPTGGTSNRFLHSVE